MVKFRLQLFGSFRLSADRGEVRLPGNKLRALFAHIASQAPVPQHREHLMALLWGTRFDTRSRQTLRQALSRLRKALGTDVFVVEGDLVGIKSGIIECDVQEFETLLTNGSYQALRSAVELFQGDFLSNVSVKEEGWQDWLLEQRQRLHSYAVDAMVQIGEIDLKRGHASASLSLGQRAVRLDPFREDAHRLIMCALALLGRRADSLRYYEQLVEQLRKDLTTGPDEQTVLCWQDIRGVGASYETMPGSANRGSLVTRSHEPSQIADRSKIPALPAPSLYAVVMGCSRLTDAVEPLILPDKPSIAVLPFDNMSNDPEQGFFADGMAEDIITALSKFRWFFVIDRNSSFTYKGKATSAREVARELGVQYVLEGSVRKAGDRVRITAQLIDANSGNHIWAERYDHQLVDIFALQDEITETIVSTIEPELSGVERERARRKPPENLDVWERYQHGLWHLWKKTSDNNDEAERLFLDVINLDPGFAPAHAALAYILFDRVALGWTKGRDDTLQRSLRAGQRAVSLDDKDPFAHFALGRVHALQENYDSAISELQTAIDLNPNFAMAHYGLGHALAWAGREGEALTPLYRAMRLSPHDPLYFAFENMAGCCHLQLGEYEQALKLLSNAARNPNGIFWSHAVLAMAFVELNRPEEAQASLEEALRLQPDLSLSTISTMIRPLRSGFKNRITKALRDLGLPN